MSPKQYLDALNAAAEATHDRFYHLSPSTSDMGLMFCPEREKQEWREAFTAGLLAFEKAIEGK